MTQPSHQIRGQHAGISHTVKLDETRKLWVCVCVCVGLCVFGFVVCIRGACWEQTKLGEGERVSGGEPEDKLFASAAVHAVG